MKIEFFGSVSHIGGLPAYHPVEQAEVENIKLLDVVALTHDVPEHNLKRGEVGTVVEILSNGDAFEVEFSDLDGQMYESLSFRPSELMVLHHEPIQEPSASTRDESGQINVYDRLIPWSLNCLYPSITSDKL